MAVFRQLLYAALCAGLLSGAFAATAHLIGTVPLILKAEAYEQPQQHANDPHHQTAPEWAPENGVERAAYTLAADLLTGVGFALLLAAGLALRGGEITWREGLFWGLAGFAAFTLSPGLGLPPAGTERFHTHALLRIYVDGILSPVPKNIGIYRPQHIEGSLHTHDETGIVHMESTHPHHFTLGDFFTVWGVKLGPDRVGGLTGLGGDKLHFYLNGKPLRDAAAHRLRDEDVIVIGYGAPDSFPHRVNTEALRLLKSAKGTTLACSKVRNGRRIVRCFAPRSGSR